jgi:hypothetical protein
VNRFSGAFSLELQHAPERHHFAVGRAELLVQVETLTLGGEQPCQDVSNLRKIVVSEGGDGHEGIHDVCRQGPATHNRINGSLVLRDR